MTTDIYNEAVYGKRAASPDPRARTAVPWIIIDDFCPEIDRVRASALESGFGTWRPNKGKVGSSIYEGMNFWGLHSLMLRPLAKAMGRCVFPNDMFFRIALPDTEPAYTHSDRTFGDFTCVAYLSEHEDFYGTGFYRHRATGLTEMPDFDTLDSDPQWDQLKHDMIHGGEKEWEEVGLCEGQYNRAVIFSAPLFHARRPRTGLGHDEATGRMIWAGHFVV